MKYRRTPRIYEAFEKQTIQVKPLPIPPAKHKSSWLSRLLYPLIMIAAYGAMVKFGNYSPTFIIFPLIMLVPALILPLFDSKQASADTKEKHLADLREYDSYLDTLNLVLANQKDIHNELINKDFPGPAAEISICKSLSPDLWTKRAEHSDFITACLGTYTAEFPVKLEVDETNRSLCKDTKVKNKLADIEADYSYIEDTPLCINIKNNPIIGIKSSDNDTAEELVNGILLSLIAAYGYDELKIFTIVSNSTKHKNNYRWIRWLPHTWDNDKKVHYFATENVNKNNLLDLLEKIAEERSNSSNTDTLPHILAVIEDIDCFEKHPVKRFFVNSENNLGISIIFVNDDNLGIPSQSGTMVQVDNSGAASLYNHKLFGMKRIVFSGRLVPEEYMNDLARYLSKVELSDDSKSTEIPELVTMFDIVGKDAVTEETILQNWAANLCYKEGIHSLVGEVSSSELFDLNMADDADGAHMLVAGTTGSGKSEFLQTFVLSMAMRYSPDEVGFVFIDFKEGGMSEAFRTLPHNYGTLTNMDSNIAYFASRTMEMLTRERKRRARILEAYGQKINNYHKAFHESGRRDMVALPHLFIIIDEFAEVIDQYNEFKEMIISLSRVGRSLGIHLVLATQSPSTSVDTQIWSNSNTKICLRVINEEESSAVLKVKKAAEITVRGRAYCLSAYRNKLIEFQTAWSGASTSSDYLSANINVLGETGNRVIWSKHRKEAYNDSTQLNVIMQQLNMAAAKQSETTHDIVLTEALPNYLTVDDHSFSIIEDSELYAYIGLGDYLDTQMQKMIPLRLDNGNNHLLICGTPNSGKSILISSLIKQFALNYSSDAIQFAIFQFGSNSLRSLAGLSIVPEYVTNLSMNISQSEEKTSRLLPYVSSLIRQRQILFEEKGITDSRHIAEVCPHIVIVIDGYSQLMELSESFDEELSYIMTQNPSQYGIHFWISTGQSYLRGKLVSYLDTKVIMKYSKESMQAFDFSYEGIAIEERGYGLFSDITCEKPVEFKAVDEVSERKELKGLKGYRFKIPVLEETFRYLSLEQSRLKEESQGRSIIIGLDRQSLLWRRINYEDKGIIISYCEDINVKTRFIQFIIQQFNSYKIKVLTEEYNKKYYHYDNTDCNSSSDTESLFTWLSAMEDHSIVIIDHSGIINDEFIGNGYKMNKWQQLLFDKAQEGSCLIIYCDQRISSYVFSDAVKGFRNFIGIGGKGERHPFFSDSRETNSVYLKRNEAFVSLGDGARDIIKLGSES